MIDMVRHIDGFPIGTDEDIIALSKPPYYTACPNPFIEDFIKEHGKPYDEETDDYHKEPFAADVSEGKNDAIYNAHSYHTKVPYKAIMKYILHYSEPGDIILDGFSGSGMTGVAAQMCGTSNSQIKFQFDMDIKNIKWGPRYAILNDISTAATFISHNYNNPPFEAVFKKSAMDLLDSCLNECSWMFKTKHSINSAGLDLKTDYADIIYTVWSDVFVCPVCGEQLIYWDVAVDEIEGKVRDRFKCPKCTAETSKDQCSRAIDTIYDNKIGKVIDVSKQVPVQITYQYKGKRYEKKPDKDDLDLLDRINEFEIPYNYPGDELPHGYNTRQPKKSHGFYCVHHFYTKANLYVLSKIADFSKNDLSLFCLVGDLLPRSSKMHKIAVSRLNSKLSKTAGIVSGTLYIPSNSIAYSALEMLKSRIVDVSNFLAKSDLNKQSMITTQSSSELQNILENSVDYIFTDPPFGDNLMYSEINYIWESWLKVKTNNKSEAIINKTQKKALKEYQNLMSDCFKEFNRVLKPGRWMTVVFHNSQNSVWNAIQESLQKSGFIVADVRTLDKQQGSFKQLTTTTAVKQDLVISAYKPKESFQREFISHQGTIQTAWDFVRQHLEKLPVVVQKNNKIEVVVERQAFLLFDRMIAYHIVNGISVSLDAADFYKGLDERFIKRDGMYFLHDQVNEYDNARIQADVEDIQFSLFVSNEKTAIAWLYQQLITPQTYAGIQPKFMQEIRSIEKHEQLPELSVLLEDNFLKEDNGKWYIPDVNKATDVMRLREKKLVKEFEEYLDTTGKIKKFRTEAVRAGFAKLWRDRNYDLIVKTAERLPEEVVQEDEKLLMYYDISLSRLG